MGAVAARAVALLSRCACWCEEHVLTCPSPVPALRCCTAQGVQVRGVDPAGRWQWAVWSSQVGVPWCVPCSAGHVRGPPKPLHRQVCGSNSVGMVRSCVAPRRARGWRRYLPQRLTCCCWCGCQVARRWQKGDRRALRPWWGTWLRVPGVGHVCGRRTCVSSHAGAHVVCRSVGVCRWRRDPPPRPHPRLLPRRVRLPAA